MGRQHIKIAPQALAPALQILVRERGIQVVYRSELVGSQRTDGVDGNFTFEEALTRLLNGTGLTYLYLADRAITIVPADNSRSRPGENSTAMRVRGTRSAPTSCRIRSTPKPTTSRRPAPH